MSKIDVLIIVHNEHEGLLSVGNSEHAHYGCARVGYWGTGKSGYLAKRNTRIYSRFITAVFKNVDAARANKKNHNLYAKAPVSHILLKSSPN